MFKRRLAVLAATAVLAITGLAGSAMADEPSSPTAGTKVVCTTPDGKPVEITRALPAKPSDTVAPDSKVLRTEPGTMEKYEAIDIKKIDGGVAISKADPADADATFEPTEQDGPTDATAVQPAQPVVPGKKLEEGEAVLADTDGFAKTVEIICKKAE